MPPAPDAARSEREISRLTVLGATGNVGHAVVVEALRRRWHVTAIARGEEGLRHLSEVASSPLLATAAVDLLTEAPPMPSSPPDAVVVAVNTWSRPRPMLQWSPGELEVVLRENLATQLTAARLYIPQLPKGGVYLALGGATADFIVPGNAHLSVTQAALRMMVRAIGKEEGHRDVHILQLLIAAMVRGHRGQELTGPTTVSAEQVAARACDIVARPNGLAGTTHLFPAP